MLDMEGMLKRGLDLRPLAVCVLKLEINLAGRLLGEDRRDPAPDLIPAFY
jgi:hypothetical protein